MEDSQAQPAHANTRMPARPRGFAPAQSERISIRSGGPGQSSLLNHRTSAAAAVHLSAGTDFMFGQ